jgi:hypothetical protein
MQNTLLFNSDMRPFEVEAIERVFQLEEGFVQVRYSTPIGTPIEADFVEGQDSTIVRLSGNRNRISLSGTSDAALRAALILRKHLDTPLRMVDTDYSFDLILRDLMSLEELRSAIDKARR